MGSPPYKTNYAIPKRANTPEEKLTVVSRLYKLWLANPELRLSQLISNVYPHATIHHLPTGPHIVDEGQDPYHTEDWDFITALEKSYE